VLAPPLLFRQYEEHAATVDGSFLPYIIEELISLSAMEVCFYDQRVNYFINTLPKTFRKRVKVLESGKVDKALSGIFKILGEEFNFEYNKYSFSFESMQNKEIFYHMVIIHNEIEKLLYGIEFELEIDIDIILLKNSSKFLRYNAKNKNVRAILASLEGILNTYNLRLTPSLKLVPEISPELLSNFMRILEDEAYAHMSINAHDLGKPSRIGSSITSMRRAAEDILVSKRFKKLFNLGSKSIKLATQVPIPDSEFTELIFRKFFLPPIVSIKNSVDIAVKNWKKDSPDIIFPN
jgi:hypothetical protein